MLNMADDVCMCSLVFLSFFLLMLFLAAVFEKKMAIIWMYFREKNGQLGVKSDALSREL